MKYTTIVFAALLGFTQAVTLREDGDNSDALADGSEGRRSIFPKPAKDDTKDVFGRFKEAPADPVWPLDRDDRMDVIDRAPKQITKAGGKGKIYEGTAGADSFQGQSVKVLPDTETVTNGESTCWAKHSAEDDGKHERHTTKDFAIKGKITVKEDTQAQSWSQSQGESDGSAQKEGRQSVEVLDSAYKGQLGELTSSSCPQSPVTDFH